MRVYIYTYIYILFIYVYIYICIYICVGIPKDFLLAKKLSHEPSVTSDVCVNDHGTPGPDLELKQADSVSALRFRDGFRGFWVRDHHAP